jgi:hypothetical protein
MRPDAFAAVMATGIVSIAAADATAIAWRRESWDLRDVDTAVGLLTYVAACAIERTTHGSWRV